MMLFEAVHDVVVHSFIMVIRQQRMRLVERITRVRNAYHFGDTGTDWRIILNGFIWRGQSHLLPNLVLP
jgi:hypothetical protein